MLQSITASNIAVVSHIHVDLCSGLNVFTGETGAGKSVLLDALAFGLGSRAQTTLIREGAHEASVTLVFELIPPYTFLEDLHIPIEDNTLIIRRFMTKDGKGKCFINDTATTVSSLKTLGESLIEIHGQFDRLLLPTHHRMALDSFGDLEPLSKEVQETYEKWKKAERDLFQTKQILQTQLENKEYTEFCAQELQQFNPQPKEEETLVQQRSLVLHKEKIQSALKNALRELQEKAPVESIFKNTYRFLQQGNVDGQLSLLIERTDLLLVEIQEFMSELEQAGQEFEEQNQELSLEFLEQRLFSLRALAKKHRCSPDDLPDFLLQLQVNLDAISNSDASVKALEKEADLCKLTYKNKATDLSAKRKEVAHYLEKVIAQELPPLKLQAHLKVNFHSIPEDQWSEHGMETIEFFVSTNPGDPFGPLSKIASGGELSRIMLALKVVLNQKNQVPTLIFDEIDTGTGGSVADAMGKRLHGFAKNVQVLAVTHSPQVASYGDHHYFVSKALEEGRMKTTIEELRDHSQKVEEIARMLSGSSITPQAKAAAEELLKD